MSKQNNKRSGRKSTRSRGARKAERLMVIPWSLSYVGQYTFDDFTTISGTISYSAANGPMTITPSVLQGWSDVSAVFDQYRFDSLEIVFDADASDLNQVLYYVYDPDGGDPLTYNEMFSRPRLKSHRITADAPDFTVSGKPGAKSADGEVKMQRWYDFAATPPIFYLGHMGCKIATTSVTTRKFVATWKAKLSFRGRR